MNDMLSNCPKYYETSRIFNSYLEAVSPEVEEFKKGIDDVLNQFFVPTATWGLDKWEEELNLESYSGKPEEQRRSRVISKLRGMGTVTVNLIKNVAESYSNGKVEVIEDNPNYTFTIKFVGTMGIPKNMNDLKEAIEEIKPAHLDYDFDYVYLTWNQFDTYNKTWDEWDNLNLTWDEFETYEEAI